MITKLEEKFDFQLYCKFDTYLSLLESGDYKNAVLEKLNGESAVLYKQFILDQLIEILYSKYDNILKRIKLISLLNQNPKFLFPEILEQHKFDFGEIISMHASADLIFNLLESNLNIDLNKFLLKNYENIDVKYLEILFAKKITYGLEKKIFDIQLQKENYEFVLTFSKQLFPDLHNYYDTIIARKVDPVLYFELWKNGYASLVPTEYFNVYFDSQVEKYTEIDTWIQRGVLQINEISEILYNRILNISEIRNRTDFDNKLYSIQKFIQLNSNNISVIQSLEDGFSKLILWHLGYSDYFDLELLKFKFIYFQPEEQVYIFKRLFYLKHTNQLEFSFNELDKIVRADIDIYLDNEQFKNDYVLDISTHVILEAINNYIEKRNFFFESELIRVDLKNNSNKSSRLKIILRNVWVE
ncbi:MAG: hypothetical protein IPK46_03120 [Saprospiraceae bacterium]|nr:hypothetical protein [Saprospiraceae bacterium]